MVQRSISLRHFSVAARQQAGSGLCHMKKTIFLHF